jgi:hypothetical protein
MLIVCLWKFGVLNKKFVIRKMRTTIIIAVLIGFICSPCYCQQRESDKFFDLLARRAVQKDLLADDIRLFKDVAWDLAVAVDAQDTVAIASIVKQRGVYIDAREPKYGMTLLIWAVSQKKFYSAKQLLKLGAQPNLQDTYDGTSAITAAADNHESSDFLKLVLEFGGNPNNEVLMNTPVANRTPLIAASKNRLESVKILVEAGANINYGIANCEGALFQAVLLNQVDIVHYLLIDRLAEFSSPMLKNDDGSSAYLVDFLRFWTYPLNSKEYKMKMVIVDYLKAHGMDYWKTEIPKHMFKQYSKDYLEKY